MTTRTDQTHDPARNSWMSSARDHADFPIQNLPYGVFLESKEGASPQIGVAIGDEILDLSGCVAGGFLALPEMVSAALSTPVLNEFLALGPDSWTETRRAISDLLQEETASLRDDPDARSRLLVSQAEVEMLLPVTIGDYTDFYCSIHHALNVGSMFRPDNPLLPNYRHLPVGYHGRASSIVPSGTPVRRPRGQVVAPDADCPAYGPSRLLDYELEMGFFAGPGNPIGSPITMAEAPGHIFGLCILNDWSARDVQKWEYQPLGPFNAKNFCTSISHWVVTLDALAPFREPGMPRGDEDPPVLPYLKGGEDLGLNITVEAFLASPAMQDGGGEHRLSRGNFRNMYWTIDQMLAHHTSTGCNIRPGDLIASGTVSGPGEDERGCMLELTWRGENPVELPDGTQRRFLEDGDELIIRASCAAEGAVPIGFGECRGHILPAIEG